jgi:hypothetical protein
MKSKNISYFSTSFAAIIMAVFIMGSINQSMVIQEKPINNEPAVVSTSPSDGEVDVARNVVIEITFNEAMGSMSMENSTFTLMQGTESVEGTFEYSGKKGMFTANRSLKAETGYTAIITIANNHSDHGIVDEKTEENYLDKNGKKWSFTTGGNSVPVQTVDLGSASDYVILAQSSIHNDSTSAITGEKGFDPDVKSSKANKTAYWLNNKDIDREAVRRDTMHKKNHNRDYSVNEAGSDTDSLDKAVVDMKSAYTDAAERSPVDFIDFKFLQSNDQADTSGNYNRVDYNEMNHADRTVTTDTTDTTVTVLDRRENAGTWASESTNDASLKLEPGIYMWNDSVEISTNITLSGNAEDVWIFQIPEGLTVSRDVEITLRDGAVAEHIFWQVGGEVSLGEFSHFEGIILSLTGITMKNGATLNGRMLAQTDVTLDDNTINEPQITVSDQSTSSNE